MSDKWDRRRSDAFCYPAGDTHGSLDTAPDEMTGCLDNYYQNGDLDFDGTPYWPEWPTGPNPTAKFPGSFVQQLPTTSGAQYSQFFLQTDLALSESTCEASGIGCAVPPRRRPATSIRTGPVSPSGAARCTLEFGNVSSGNRGQRLRGRRPVRRRPAADPRLSGVRRSGDEQRLQHQYVTCLQLERRQQRLGSFWEALA